MKKFGQFFAAFLVGAFLLQGAPALAAKTYTQAQLDKLFNDSGKKTRKLVTSNSVHFWAWAKNEADGYVGDYLAPEGEVMGDPHPRNVFDYRNGGKAKLAIADIDDSGEAPLFLDIVRYVVYTESLNTSMKIGDIFDAYLDGLKGKPASEPKALASARGDSQKDIDAAHLKYIRKHTKKSGKLDLEDLELTGQDEMSPAQKKTLAELSKVALKKSGLSAVIDAGYKVNDSGSSKDMDRYWILLGDRGEGTLLMEFKELSRSAVSYYERQDNTASRVNAVLDVYSEDGLDADKFGVVSSGNQDFWMRPRHYQSLDVDEKEFSEKEMRDFAEYMANWMGLAQRSQASGAKLLKLIEKDPREAKEALEKMVRAYLEELKT
ncbi:MAG: DUF2252 family protein [Bdellovibrionota bacterium]